ncbi:MAG: hypothetical protein N2D54_07785 [Chloroflexota bacterium]
MQNNKKTLSYFLWGLVLVFGVVLIRTAWMNDDAVITLRSISNFDAGYGPVYNLGERVQTFTHPLWFDLPPILVPTTMLDQLGEVGKGWG